ncbi:hypothetical protein C8F01DRAFT_1113578 [Mycena amicta]|nr:hypothetical protein C8F01DRAFT_1113578 [Mycena amicta]
MSTFCADELRNALTEESSTASIDSFHLTSSEPLCATASVRLLEGRTISVGLTTNGFSIVDEGLTFESMDQLLRSVSTMYERRRQEALMAALERLSE